MYCAFLSRLPLQYIGQVDCSGFYLVDIHVSWYLGPDSRPVPCVCPLPWPLQVGDDSSSESSSVVRGAGGDPKEIDWARCFSSVHQGLTNVMYFV